MCSNDATTVGFAALPGEAMTTSVLDSPGMPESMTTRGVVMAVTLSVAARARCSSLPSCIPTVAAKTANPASPHIQR